MEKIQLTKSQKILFIILGIVLAYAIFDFLSHKETYLNYYSGKQPQMNNAAQTNLPDSTQKIDPLKASLFSKWGRDPFLRVEKVKTLRKRKKRKVVQHFKLRAVSYRREGSVALINDRIVKVGDVIKGYRVVKIEEKRVILRNGKKRIILKLTNM